MKRFLIILTMFMVIFSSMFFSFIQADNIQSLLYFYDGSKKIFISQKADEYFVSVKESETLYLTISEIKNIGFDVVYESVTKNSMWIKKATEYADFEDLKQNTNIKEVDPIFEFENGSCCILNNKIYLQPFPDEKIDFKWIEEKYNGTLIKHTRYGPLYYMY